MKTLLILLPLILIGCAEKPKENPPPDVSPVGELFYYVSTGLTFAGNSITTGSNPTNSIYKYDGQGRYVSKVADYRFNSGENLVKVINYSESSLLALIESSAGRRIDLVQKNGSGSIVYLSNSTAFPGGTSPYVRDVLYKNTDLYVLKSTGVEKFNANKTRVMVGANNFISLPVSGSCGIATASLALRKMEIGPSGNFILLHASAGAGLRKIMYVKNTGYATTADCLADISLPTVNDHYPTAALYHSSGKLFVAFSNGATGTIYHEIWQYDISETSISNGVKVFSDLNNIRGITDLSEIKDGRIVVSSMDQNYNNIGILKITDTGLTLEDSAFIEQSFDNRSTTNVLESN